MANSPCINIFTVIGILVSCFAVSSIAAFLGIGVFATYDVLKTAIKERRLVKVYRFQYPR